MSDPAPRQATYQDVIDAPEHMTAEIWAGELHLSPRPAYLHQVASSGAGAELFSEFGRSGSGRAGGWVILYEPELHLGGHIGEEPTALVLVPDLAGWRKKRFSPPEAHGHTIVPDWVCEVLSPGSRNIRRDRIQKADLYHRVGVPWLWILDPAAQTVESYQREEAGYLRVAAVAGSVEARIPPFDAVAIDLSPWWAGDEEE